MDIDQIKASLDALDLPQKAAIAEWHVETGRDSTGDPAVWVFVVVHDERLRGFEADWPEIRQRITDAVAVESPEAFTYVRLQLTSEIHPAAVGSITV